MSSGKGNGYVRPTDRSLPSRKAAEFLIRVRVKTKSPLIMGEGRCYASLIASLYRTLISAEQNAAVPAGHKPIPAFESVGKLPEIAEAASKRGAADAMAPLEQQALGSMKLGVKHLAVQLVSGTSLPMLAWVFRSARAGALIAQRSCPYRQYARQRSGILNVRAKDRRIVIAQIRDRGCRLASAIDWKPGWEETARHPAQRTVRWNQQQRHPQ